MLVFENEVMELVRHELYYVKKVETVSLPVDRLLDCLLYTSIIKAFTLSILICILLRNDIFLLKIDHNFIYALCICGLTR